MEQKQVMKLGEQLTGLSPTVCRRAIAALRAANKALGGEKRKKALPLYCKGLLLSLFYQTKIGTGTEWNDCATNTLPNLLDQVDIFLDIVEGKIAEERLAAIANPLNDPHEAAEETARRG